MPLNCRNISWSGSRRPTHHTQCSLPEPMAEIVVRPGLGVFARKEGMAKLGMIHVAWLVVQTRRIG